MTEIVEYALVILVSSIFVAGSLGSYGLFTSFESNLQLKTNFASLSNVEYSAAIHGSAMAVLDFPPMSSLNCAGGLLSLRAGPSIMTESVPEDCQFSINLAQGVDNVTLLVRGDTLRAVAS